VIVDFTIEDNSVFAVIYKNRLIPTFKIDDFEARCAKRKQIGRKDALLIRTSVDESCHRVPNPVL
jgi:hypothetical protein